MSHTDTVSTAERHPIRVAWRDAARLDGAGAADAATDRLVLDLAALGDVGREILPDEFSEAWQDIRRRIAVVPGPRERHRTTAATVVRQALEGHALGLNAAGGIREIVDVGLAASIDRIAALGPESDLSMVLDSNWDRAAVDRRQRRRLIAASIGGGLVAMVGGLLVRADLTVPVAGLAAVTVPIASRRRSPHRPDASLHTVPHANERVRVGRGWIETDSGRRRHRTDLVTTVLRESPAVGRIEVRLVGLERVVRLRFESIDDPSFRRFWSRWAA